jgi:hypothetical protein
MESRASTRSWSVYDGVVYEKDFGAETSEQFQKMELFNPDKTWEVVSDSD